MRSGATDEVWCTLALSASDPERGPKLRLVEAFDGDLGRIADERHRHGAEAARDKIVIRVEVSVYVFDFERHAGS